jgi:tRNA A37 threonylcarbamoyladenosine dehydratase
MRRELKKRGISHVKVVYSKEEALTPIESGDIPRDVMDGKETENAGRKKIAPASIAFVPSVAGLIIAGEVIKDLCGL